MEVNADLLTTDFDVELKKNPQFLMYGYLSSPVDDTVS